MKRREFDGQAPFFDVDVRLDGQRQAVHISEDGHIIDHKVK